MDAGKGDAHDTADMENGDAALRGSLEALVASNEGRGRDRRRKLRGTPQAKQSGQRGQPRNLQEAQHAGGGAHQFGMAEESARNEAVRPPFARSIEPILGAADLRSGAFDELAVPNAGGADGF